MKDNHAPHLPENCPLFSVCVPARNASHFLVDCLNSVLSQTCPSWEVIVVDDASTDGTYDLLSCQTIIPADKIEVVSFAQNRGPYYARRVAIAHAHGSYLLFLDADDTLIGTDALQQLATIIDGVYPDVVLFNLSDKSDGSNRLIAYEQLFGNALDCPGKAISLDAQKCLSLFLSTYKLNNLASKAIKRELLMDDIATPNFVFRVAEDRVEVFNALQKARSIYLFDRALYYYRSNGESTTHKALDIAYCLQQAFAESTILAHLGHSNDDIEKLINNYMGMLAFEMRALVMHKSVRQSIACIRKLRYEPFCGNACKTWLALPKHKRHGRFDVWARALLFRHDALLPEVVLCKILNLISRARAK